MTAVHIPDAIDLRTAPELAALAVLDAALAVADHVLRYEHVHLEAAESPLAPRDAKLALCIVAACRDLRRLLRAYDNAVRPTDTSLTSP